MARLLTIAGLIIFVATSPAQADLTLESLGAPIEGGSWFQDFRLFADTREPGASFERLGIGLTSFSSTMLTNRILPFEGLVVGPALDFSAPWATAGWREEFVVPGPEFAHSAQAVGERTSELLWRSHFRDDPDSHAFTMTLFTYDSISDLLPKDSIAARWTGTDWVFDVEPGLTWQNYQMMATPVPNAALFAAIGLALVGLVKRRIK